MATSCTDFNHPYYEKLNGLNFQEKTDFFIKDKSHMQHVSLGEMLDFISFGDGNYVCYPFSIRDLTEFTKIWIDSQNKEVLFNREEKSQKVKLPRINYERCPYSLHDGTVEDFAGNIRCAHVEREYYIEGFVTEHEYLDICGSRLKKLKMQKK